MALNSTHVCASSTEEDSLTEWRVTKTSQQSSYRFGSESCNIMASKKPLTVHKVEKTAASDSKK